MTDDERDDLMASYAAQYVAAEHGGDHTEIGRVVGVWDGRTGAPAWWVKFVLDLLAHVAHMIPAAQIDWAAIEDVMAGRFPLEALNPVGKFEVIARLARNGCSDQDIADRIGMQKNSVCQFRKRHNIPAGVPASRPVSGAQAEEGAA